MIRRPTTVDFKPRRMSWKRSYRSLLSPEQMAIAVQRETSRADRNGGEFALALFRVRNNDRSSLSTVRLAKTILRRVRATDDVGWYDDQFLAALLPDTSPAGAWQFAEQVLALVSGRAAKPLCKVYSYPATWFNPEEEQARAALLDPEVRMTGGMPAAPQNGVQKIFPTSLDRLVGSPLSGSPLNGNPDRPIPADGQARRSGAVAEVRPLESLLVRPLPLWKRSVDIAGSLAALIVTSPVMLLAALLVRISGPGPIVFKQQRAGLGGRPFRIYKFRTMCIDAEAKQADLKKLNEQDGPAFKIAKDPRVTRIGQLLRTTSIDELPQLFNVLKGDMTLVGPRPLPIGESEQCAGWYRRRLDVTPGLTCIWQIKGRSQVSFCDWVRMDVAYIRRRTLLTDIRILFQTIPAVLLRRGAR
jgi:lipopolysaccharide/colanic/teichoic acid biosynthesis glycosyltransferase